MNGALVKNWMKKQGMRPEALAVKLNVSLSTVKNIMNGKKSYRPYGPLVTVLANLMGVPEKTLLGQQKPGGQKATGT